MSMSQRSIAVSTTERPYDSTSFRSHARSTPHRCRPRPHPPSTPFGGGTTTATAGSPAPKRDGTESHRSTVAIRPTASCARRWRRRGLRIAPVAFPSSDPCARQPRHTPDAHNRRALCRLPIPEVGRTLPCVARHPGEDIHESIWSPERIVGPVRAVSRPPRWIDASTTQILACLRCRGRRLGSTRCVHSTRAREPWHVLVVGRVADPRLLCIGKDSPLQLQDSPGVGSHVDAWWRHRKVRTQNHVKGANCPSRTAAAIL